MPVRLLLPITVKKGIITVNILKRGTDVRNNKKRNTISFDESEYNPDLIEEYTNSEYERAAEEYARNARKAKKRKNKHEKHRQQPVRKEEQSFEDMIAAEYMDGESESSQEKNRSGKKNKKSGSRKKKNRKYKVNKFKVVRNVLLVIIILLLLATGMFFALTRGLEHTETDISDFDITPSVDENLKDYRNILILGSDARADEDIDYSRTDAIIVMSINKKNNDVRLISVMRDSYLKMAYGDEMILDKLTHAHAYGGGVNTAATLNRSLDLNISEYIVFNWKSVADTVDTLGGIKVKVRENEIDDLNRYGKETAENVGGTFTRIEKAGVQTLDGVQATTYCRIRKTSGGDAGRTVRYKKILSGVMKKAITRPDKIGKVVDIISPNIRTNMSQKDMFTAGVRAPLFDMKKGFTWPFDYYAGYLPDGISYVVPVTLESNVRELHEKAFDQQGYQLSDVAQEINQLIIGDTGIY